LLKSSVLSFCS